MQEKHYIKKRNEDGHITDFFKSKIIVFIYFDFLRKEVIQPQVPLRLPCYDFTPVADLTVAGCFHKG